MINSVELVYSMIDVLDLKRKLIFYLIGFDYSMYDVYGILLFYRWYVICTWFECRREKIIERKVSAICASYTQNRLFKAF